MTLTTSLWLLSTLAVAIGCSIWLAQGRRHGYQALAERTAELLREGADEVYLLDSNAAPANTKLPMNLDNIWPAMSTGYLAYVHAGALIVEAPWWNRSQPVCEWFSGDTTVRVVDRAYTIWRAQPGVFVGDRTYRVMGCNVTESRLVKAALHGRTNAAGQAAFLGCLHDAGFSFSGPPSPIA